MSTDDKINIAMLIVAVIVSGLLFSDHSKRAEDAADAARWREAVKPFLANGVDIP